MKRTSVSFSLLLLVAAGTFGGECSGGQRISTTFSTNLGNAVTVPFSPLLLQPLQMSSASVMRMRLPGPSAALNEVCRHPHCRTYSVVTCAIIG